MDIDEAKQSILADLLHRARVNHEFPDYEIFRIDHKQRRHLIDQLQQDGLLMRENELYVLTWEGLLVCRSDEAKEEIEEMIRLLPVLEQAYSEKPKEYWETDTLAQQSGWDVHTLKRALKFLLPFRIAQSIGYDKGGLVQNIRLEERVLDLTPEEIRGRSIPLQGGSTRIPGPEVHSADAMYLRSLRLQNVRLISDMEFSFVDSNGKPRMWTVLIGDNGRCKTTILQAIALAASGELLSRALAQDTDLYRNARSGSQANVSIEAVFEVLPGKSGEEKNVVLSAPPGSHVFRAEASSDTAQIDEIRNRRISGYLVAGYGVGRFLPRPGEVAIPQDLCWDRVAGLFNDRHKILGVSFLEIIEGYLGEAAKNTYRSALNSVLLARWENGEALLPGVKGVSSIPSKWSHLTVSFGASNPVDLPLMCLSHGYQGMIAWISDLLGQATLDRGEVVRPEEMTGIVLIDEIDLHLHPSWQRRIVPFLKRTFPKLQFVVTTHSPLVLTGFEEGEIVRLELKGDEIVKIPAPFPPGLRTSSEILAGYYDVPRAARPELIEIEERYLELLGYSSPSEEQLHERNELKKQLAPYLGSDDDLEDWEEP
jgi:predicted ATPase